MSDYRTVEYYYHLLNVRVTTIGVRVAGRGYRMDNGGGVLVYEEGSRVWGGWRGLEAMRVV